MYDVSALKAFFSFHLFFLFLLSWMEHLDWRLGERTARMSFKCKKKYFFRMSEEKPFYLFFRILNWNSSLSGTWLSESKAGDWVLKSLQWSAWRTSQLWWREKWQWSFDFLVHLHSCAQIWSVWWPQEQDRRCKQQKQASLKEMSCGSNGKQTDGHNQQLKWIISTGW